MNCHNRASYPPLNFLPIYRGDPHLQHDPTYAAGRLRTEFLLGLCRLKPSELKPVSDAAVTIPADVRTALAAAKRLARSLDQVRAIDYGFSYKDGKTTDRLCSLPHGTGKA